MELKTTGTMLYSVLFSPLTTKDNFVLCEALGGLGSLGDLVSSG